jgi:enoyl-CoA hydratase/carnithine racemase
MSELVDYQRKESVALITLNRPERRNALTAEMMESLLAGVERATLDDDVKSVVIRGEGPVFCSGYDITDPTDFQGSPDQSVRERIRSIQVKSEWMRRLLLSGKPLIASVHGLCIGIGTYLVLVADFAVVSDDAALGLPEERFGSAGATWAYPYLIREIGLKRANELVMTGRRFTASEFEALGLVNRVVPAEQLAAATDALCRALSSLPRDGIATNRAVKALALATIGHLDSFGFHAAFHTQAERIERGSDEFNFITALARHGMREATAQRDRAFEGEWWGW